ncbi:MAG TPA: hypothetical protein VFG30_25075 [Polyangiales bacterium]|nr:hypothetical protein [Polyangiales bacterium]
MTKLVVQTSRSFAFALLVSAVVCVAAACGNEADAKSDRKHSARVDAGADQAAEADAATPGAGAAGQPTIVDGRPAFCAREGDDAVRDLFCASEKPAIASLADFQNLFDINPRGPDPNTDDEFATALYLSAANGDIAVLSHSTALPGHIISPINPRTISIGAKIVLAYQRGVQRLEIATRTRETFAFTFYLLSFEQACNERDGGCTPGDLYTPKIENDWTQVQIRDDEDLKNTTFDCRQCHRRGREDSRLLMRELKSPWTHFMFPVGASSSFPGVTGSDLMNDYLVAKGDELYGGLSPDLISPISAFQLQSVAGPKQPLLFDAPGIENERWPWSPSGYPSTPSPSPTWEGAWEAFKRGEQLALPYIEQRAVDVDKQAELSRAYQRYRSGEIDADALPDLADVFPDDPSLRAKIGLQTEPDASAEDALIQACGGCHNDVLDQSITRARFSVALSRLDRAEIDVAIDRIQRPRNAPGAMPPPEARQLDENARDRVLEYLRQDLKQIEIDPRLEKVATFGMMGGGGG